MYVHLGGGVTVPSREVAAVFDLDNATTTIHTRRFLERAEGEGRVIPLGDDLPRSFVLADGGEGRPVIYLVPLSPAALSARAERDLPI